MHIDVKSENINILVIDLYFRNNKGNKNPNGIKINTFPKRLLNQVSKL
jgi:hypothetical protein